MPTTNFKSQELKLANLPVQQIALYNASQRPYE